MNLLDLMIKIGVDDQASSGLDGVVANAKNVASSIGSGLATAAKVGTAAVGAATGAMAALTKTALDASGELEQNTGGLMQVFQEQAAGMESVASTAFSNMGLSASDFMATANRMGALFQGSGFDIAQSADMAKEAMQRASDVSSIMGLDVSAAMEAVTGAAKGNFTMMDNLGVAINDTTLQQYALAQGIETSTREMTTQQKVGLAMELFMEKTAYAAGNYAKENETLAGSLTTAGAAMQNFLSGAGSAEDLAASFSDAASVITNNVVEIVPRLTEGITTAVSQLAPQIPVIFETVVPAIVDGTGMLAQQMLNGIETALSSGGGALVGSALEMVANITEGILSALPQVALVGAQLITELGNGIASNIPAVMTAATEAITGVVEIFSDGTTLTNVLNAGIAIITALLTGLVEAIPSLVEAAPQIILAVINALLALLPSIIETGVTLITALIQNLPQAITVIVAAIPAIVTAIIGVLTTLIPQIVQAGVQLLVALVENMPQIISAIVAAIPSIVDAIVNTLSTLVPLIVSAGFELFVALIQNLPQAIANIVAAVPDIVGAIVSAITARAGDIVQAGKNLISGLGDGIKRGWEAIKGAVTSTFTAVTDTVKGVFDINSPSRVFAGIGENIMAGLEGGIESGERRYRSLLESVLAVPASAPTMSVPFRDSAMGRSSTGMINSIFAASGDAEGGVYNINLVVDGRTLASVVFNPLQEISKQKGETVLA